MAVCRSAIFYYSTAESHIWLQEEQYEALLTQQPGQEQVLDRSTSKQVREPSRQPPPLMTKDMLEEQKATLTALGNFWDAVE